MKKLLLVATVLLWCVAYSDAITDVWNVQCTTATQTRVNVTSYTTTDLGLSTTTHREYFIQNNSTTTIYVTVELTTTTALGDGKYIKLQQGDTLNDDRYSYWRSWRACVGAGESPNVLNITQLYYRYDIGKVGK